MDIYLLFDLYGPAYLLYLCSSLIYIYVLFASVEQFPKLFISDTQIS